LVLVVGVCDGVLDVAVTAMACALWERRGDLDSSYQRKRWKRWMELGSGWS
jgi:hypothetical protein